MKTPTITAPITELVIWHAEIAFMNKESLYDSSKIVGNEKEEATLPLALTGKSAALSFTSKHDEKK